MDVFTIGYEGRGVADFAAVLREHSVRRILDVRRDNVTEPGRLSNGSDLNHLSTALFDVEYVHDPYLGPTADLLADLKQRGGSWAAYERGFRALMARRKIEDRLSPAWFETPTVLLCAERGPDHCHRRLVAEHLASHWPGLRPIHL